MAKFTPQAEMPLGDQLKVRREKLADLVSAGNDPFTVTKYPVDIYSTELKEKFADLAAEENSGVTVHLAGRMMSKRIMGKASFAHLRDGKGDIQIFVKRDELGDDAYAAFKKLDIGDVVGCAGEVFRTKTGELSVRVSELTLLERMLDWKAPRLSGESLILDPDTMLQSRQFPVVPGENYTILLRMKNAVRGRNALCRAFLRAGTALSHAETLGKMHFRRLRDMPQRDFSRPRRAAVASVLSLSGQNKPLLFQHQHNLSYPRRIGADMLRQFLAGYDAPAVIQINQSVYRHTEVAAHTPLHSAAFARLLF